MEWGEVWTLNLEPTLGAEIRKTRTVVIVSADEIGILPLRVIVPLTEWHRRFEVAPWMVRIEPNRQNGLSKPSAADAFQVRSVSTSRFVRQLGRLTSEEMDAIIAALMSVFRAKS